MEPVGSTAVNDTKAPVLGRDLGLVGRILRVLTGGWLILYAISLAHRGGYSIGETVQIAGYTLAVTAFYTVLTYILGRRLLDTLNPWTGAALLLSPLVIVGGLDQLLTLPSSLLAGLLIYAGLSLLLMAIIGYGGCEIIGIPVALLRRRYTVYCALNTIDAAEGALSHSRHGPGHVLAGALALLAGVYYFLLQFVFDLAGVDLPLDPRWGTTLLVPALAVLANRAWADRATGTTNQTRRHTIGAAALTTTMIGILIFGSVFPVLIALTGMIFIAGIATGLRQAMRSGARVKT